KKKLKLDPLFVDLCPPPDTRLGYRVNKNTGSSSSSGDGGGGELLLKALGIKKILAERNHNGGNDDHDPLIIYDLTAGLARDSLIILSSFLANADSESSQQKQPSMPLRLHMVERDPIVGTLLLDAMRRLDLLAADTSNHQSNKTARQLTKNLSMEQGDGVSVLNRLMSTCTSDSSTPAMVSPPSKVPYPPDIVYLDPMFPPRKKKSSAVKKDMAMLHSLLGTAGTRPNNTPNNDDDVSSSSQLEPSILDVEEERLNEERALLRAAHSSATRRVVVKRPIRAQHLGLS
ncbi:hypothetical protein ACHAXR_000525, partial [Thalassiosira sp. AJA248-18]